MRERLIRDRVPTAAKHLAVIVLVSAIGSAAGAAGKTSLAHADPPPRLAPLLARQPSDFIENRGQVDSRARYYLQGAESAVFFTKRGVRISLQEKASKRWNLALDFVGARHTEPGGVGRTRTVVSYFSGEVADWRTGVPTYSRVVYREAWPGIDMEWSTGPSQLKYRFLVHPGADPSDIRLRWRGARAVALNSGRMTVSTPVRSLTDDAPTSYQRLRGGRRAPVASSFVLDGPVFGFDVGSYDRRRPLVIDPAIVLYAGYIGGSEDDLASAVAVDAQGAAYVTGQTSSTEDIFPDVVGPDSSYNNGPTDAFVAKVSPDGASLVYAGFIGGDGEDWAGDIAVDADGAAYISGSTTSAADTFPVAVGPSLTLNAGQPCSDPDCWTPADAFVAKVAPDGTSLDFAGYVGGATTDVGQAIAVDATGAAYLTGMTYSDETTFPVAVGPSLTFVGGEQCSAAYGCSALGDAFVAKIAPSGASLTYAGYIAAWNSENGLAIDVDAAGAAYVSGETLDYHPQPGVQCDTFYGCSPIRDGFVAKVDADGAGLAYMSPIARYGGDLGQAIAVDGSGAAYVTGETSVIEPTFPVVGGPDLTHNGQADAFVAKLSPAGNLVYAGYIGGSGNDFGHGIAVDLTGSAYVSGTTGSDEATFPVGGGPDGTHNGGWTDGFVAKVAPDGASLVYAGYIGGSGTDMALDVALDATGSSYVVGWTRSSEASFPVAVGPDLTYAGSNDTFVAKLEGTSSPPDATPPETTITAGPAATTRATSATFEFTANETATFGCSLDGEPFVACMSPKTYTALGEGSHSFRVRATDDAGNRDSTPAERNWTVQPNTPPVASFTYSCAGLTCNLDAGSSADSDGTIVSYGWAFSDGSGASGNSPTVVHTYAQEGDYLVTLTVSDNDGATGTSTTTVTPMTLTARGYKVGGLQKVDLSWRPSSAATFHLYRNAKRIATVPGNTYTDNINKRGAGTYTYKVCAAAAPVCSSEVAVKF